MTEHEHEQIIKQLEAQNALPDTSAAQREANEWRIKWLRWAYVEKTLTEPPVFFDPVTQAIENPDWRFSPRVFLIDERY